MILITTTERGSETVIRVAGRLEAAHIAELEAAAKAATERPVLDLAELQGADPQAVRQLVALAEGGARITGASPFIRLLLERADEVNRPLAPG